jgi:low temperature requirement protein LtrA
VVEAAPTLEENPSRPAFTELFFDLAFVFALIALTQKLVRQLSWESTGHTLVLLLAFMLLWSLTAWAGDYLSQPQLLPRVVGVMAGSLVLAAMVADAYRSRGLQFAVVYVAVHLGTGLFMLTVPRTPVLKLRTRRIITWETAAGIVWIAGGLVTGTGRDVLWAVGVAVEYAGAILGWPLPWSWRRIRHGERFVAERIAERFRQFVIIALGVSIFVTGGSLSDTERATDHAVAFVAAFVITVLIWRIYIYRAGELMTIAIDRAINPLRTSQLTTFVHLVMVAGIVVTAGANNPVIRHPLGETRPSWAAVILAGPALFLIGRVLLDKIVFAGIDRARVVGLVVLAGLGVAATQLSPIVLMLVVMAILAMVAAWNLIVGRGNPPTPAAVAGGQA